MIKTTVKTLTGDIFTAEHGSRTLENGLKDMHLFLSENGIKFPSIFSAEDFLKIIDELCNY
jgi:hypothetical protein